MMIWRSQSKHKYYVTLEHWLRGLWTWNIFFFHLPCSLPPIIFPCPSIFTSLLNFPFSPQISLRLCSRRVEPKRGEGRNAGGEKISLGRWAYSAPEEVKEESSGGDRYSAEGNVLWNFGEIFHLQIGVETQWNWRVLFPSLFWSTV